MSRRLLDDALTGAAVICLFAGCTFMAVFLPARDAWRRFVKRNIVDDYPFDLDM